MVDDELACESQQIRVHGLEQSWDENHSQVVGRHLVHLREHLDSVERHVSKLKPTNVSSVLTTLFHVSVLSVSITCISVQIGRLVLFCCRQAVFVSFAGMLKICCSHLKSLQDPQYHCRTTAAWSVEVPHLH